MEVGEDVAQLGQGVLRLLAKRHLIRRAAAFGAQDQGRQPSPEAVVQVTGQVSAGPTPPPGTEGRDRRGEAKEEDPTAPGLEQFGQTEAKNEGEDLQGSHAPPSSMRGVDPTSGIGSKRVRRRSRLALTTLPARGISPLPMCGVFGIWGHDEAAKLAYLGLHALQHRGQEAAGIVASGDGKTFVKHAGKGHVSDVFSEANLEKLAGPRAIGHVRYSTAGGPGASNAQPYAVETMRGPLAIAHNGNLVNHAEVRRELERDGALFSTRSDTETVVHLLARARAPRFQDRLREALAQVEGAYSLVMMSQDQVVAIRDPWGFRPLVLGKVGEAHIVASETCALSLVGGSFVREIEPGEIVTIDAEGVYSERLVHEPRAKKRPCIFEMIYFSRPDSHIFDQSVYEARFAMGQQLARESHVEADLVVPVPDSGVPAALGYADQAELPFRHGLLRSHYVGRTFIEPEQSIRNFGVKLKLSAVRAVLEGRRVVVVDDSLVRGTTSRKIVGMLREAGATEVHVRISCPPTTYPCYYGINTPTRKELIGANQTVPEIGDYIGADTLAYLGIDGLHAAVKDANPERSFCNACFTGRYSSGRKAIESRLAVVCP
ncbi:MAG: amidophosphoribosyltransferase [Myxococcota bacterium]